MTEVDTPGRSVVWVTLGASLAGIAVSAYLTVAHLVSPAILACSSNGIVNCEQVTSSARSRLLGVPVAYLGLAWFVAMAALTTPAAWRSRDPRIGWLRLGLASIGMAFVLYLVWAELFAIGAICLWCTVVHVLTLVLFVAVILQGRPSPIGGADGG